MMCEKNCCEAELLQSIPHNDDFTLNNRFWRNGYAPKRFYESCDDTRYFSKLGAAKGNCTWYVNGRLRSLGYTIDLEQLTGDAKTWKQKAYRIHSMNISHIPCAGVIAHTEKGDFGHIAIVEYVHDDGSITISESYYEPRGGAQDFEYRVRHIKRPEEIFECFIQLTKERKTIV